MVLVELYGRLGNAMFEIALGKYLSEKFNTELKICISENKQSIEYYKNEIFQHEFFKKLNIININEYGNYNIFKYLPKYRVLRDTINFHTLEDFNKLNTSNIILKCWYIGKNYVDYNTIKDLYVPSKELKEEIFDLYNPTKDSLLIHVRRTDYLDKDNVDKGFFSNDKEYFLNGYKYLNRNYDKIFIESDDLEWCKENLDFEDNIIYVDKKTENSKIFVDLFLQTFVRDAIISASTFSWWGTYLNTYKYKRIIMPYPWHKTFLKPHIKFKINDFYYENVIALDIENSNNYYNFFK